MAPRMVEARDLQGRKRMVPLPEPGQPVTVQVNTDHAGPAVLSGVVEARFRADDDVPEWLFGGAEGAGASWLVAVTVLRTANGFHVFPHRRVRPGAEHLVRSEGPLDGRGRTATWTDSIAGLCRPEPG